MFPGCRCSDLQSTLVDARGCSNDGGAEMAASSVSKRKGVSRRGCVFGRVEAKSMG